VEIREDKKGMETILPPKNKLVQDSEGNEENRYPNPYFNKTKTNYPKNPRKPTRTSERRNPASNH
jgi:hypothetical protein